MIRWLLNRLKPKTVRLDVRFVTFAKAEQLLADGTGWQIAPEEDTNSQYGWVWMERRGSRPAQVEPPRPWPHGLDVLLFDGESNVPCVRKSDYDAVEARIANGLKLFEDFYWPRRA
jgi:hypothetical protein